MTAESSSSPPYRIPFCDRDQWMKHLQEEGYVVVAGVLGPEDVSTARDLFYKLLEKLYDIDRDDIQTWKKWPLDQRGIDLTAEIMQGEGAWYVRSHPNVKDVFSTLWKDEISRDSEAKDKRDCLDDSLIASMDSVLLWKPWWVNDDWTPRTEGLHLDQNLVTTPQFICAQSMVTLYDVTPEIGGLEVVSRSHTKEEIAAFQERYNSKYRGYADNFIMLPRDDPHQGKGHLLLAKAGDLILWDSRTIHGGLVGTADRSHPPSILPSDTASLARLAVTVCMVPRKRAKESVLKKRREGFEKGWGFNHMPWESRVTARHYGPSPYVPITLTAEQFALL